MKTLYLECNMGAAGDMLSAALLELLPEEERASFVDKLNSLGLPGVTFAADTPTGSMSILMTTATTIITTTNTSIPTANPTITRECTTLSILSAT